jgi:hypothetical protein
LALSRPLPADHFTCAIDIIRAILCRRDATFNREPLGVPTASTKFQAAVCLAYKTDSHMEATRVPRV